MESDADVDQVGGVVGGEMGFVVADLVVRFEDHVGNGVEANTEGPLVAIARRVAAVPGGFAEISGAEVSVMVCLGEGAFEAVLDPDEIARERAQAMIEEMRETEEGEAFYRQYQNAFSEAVSPEDDEG